MQIQASQNGFLKSNVYANSPVKPVETKHVNVGQRSPELLRFGLQGSDLRNQDKINTLLNASDHPSHIPSHRDLITKLPLTVPTRQNLHTLDAIMVPTNSRTPEQLLFSLEMAHQLEVDYLVILYSGSDPKAYRAQFQKYVNDIYDRTNPQTIKPPKVTFITSQNQYQLPKLKLKTDHFNKSFNRKSDLSRKRNMGLSIAKMMGWKNVLFLDDDIKSLPYKREINGLYYLTSDIYRSQLFEGFKDPRIRIVASPYTSLNEINNKIKIQPHHDRNHFLQFDNSLVCLTSRMLGNQQDTFCGGGAMAVNIQPDLSFFPSIYNEDWLFIARMISREPHAMQMSSDLYHYNINNRLHYVNPSSGGAKQEEVGDIFAESLMRAIRLSREAKEPISFEALVSSPEYWKFAVKKRAEFIEQLQEGYQEYYKPEVKDYKPGNPLGRFFNPFTSAEEQQESLRMFQFIPSILNACGEVLKDRALANRLHRYAVTWLKDQDTWNSWYKNLPESDSMREACDYLRLNDSQLSWIGH